MKLLQFVNRLMHDERGMETVEWAVLAALMVTGIVAALSTLGANAKAVFTTLSTAA